MAIAFILIAAAGSFYLMNNMNSLLKILNKEKQKINTEYTTEKFSQGVFNYTLYAIKNRWCMSRNWDRDFECGEDMKSVVFNPLNLERLLWSRSTIDAIKDSYYSLYNSEAPEDPGLNRIKATIKIEDLERLKVSHPLNLALEPRLKNCIQDIDIEISKYLITSNIPKGDETILSISVRAKKNDNKSCEHIKGDIELDSEVAFYPRTLNVFSLIKAGDIDLSDFSGDKEDYGIRFNSKVYVENDLVIPPTGYHPIAFYNSLVVGGGSIYQGSELFTPNSSGGMSSQIYSQIPTILGIKSGITFEDEVDEGIAPLFGSKFTYPANTILDQCITRSKIRDNPFLTNNSRLFIKGNNGNYTLALSSDNEFRDYLYYGVDEDGYTVHSNSNDAGNDLDLEAKYIDNKKSDSPVMSLDLYLTGETSNQKKVLLSRSSNVDINLANTSKMNTIKEALAKDDEYIDFDSNYLNTLDDFEDIDSNRSRLENECTNMKYQNGGDSHPACKVVDESFSKEADCSSSLIKAACEQSKVDIEKYANLFNTSKSEVISEASSVISNPPVLNIKTSDKYSNEIGISFEIRNKSKLNSGLLKNITGIEAKVNAFDFAIEQTGDPVSGKRTEKSHLPGPNEELNPNLIKITVNRKRNGEYKNIEYKTADNSSISNEARSGGLSGWALLKRRSSDEPPKDGRDYVTPTQGLTTAEAKEIDEQCLSVYNVDSSEWDVSFTENTQFSWLVNVTHSGITISNPADVKPVDELIFTEDLMRPGNYKGIPNRSIIKNCIVPNSLNTVFGLYVCEKFTINERSQKLKVIGTIITKDLAISGSARKAGVDFYSMWHPMAIDYLQDKGHLRKNDGSTCEFSNPGWSPFLSSEEQRDQELCSPMKFIYEGVNNFNWTTVDPDIGIPADGTSVVTRSKIPNRYRRYTSRILWVESGVVQ
ncbi:hypothetical protein [Halobacteriovorax sp.]|uniref:hypothetical protein n=1 Tax=Halobacteriovorax sp. TaxID=2020862 RepID=UPI00356A1759